jgi:hypothetical protein
LYSDKTALTEANYIAVLDGLKNNAKVNGVRLPIFPTRARPDTYSQVYKKAIAYARSIGLAIYASPISVGMSDYDGWSSQQYATWLADYTNYFSPDFLSPFNEANIDDSQAMEIVAKLRALLRTNTLINGPDRQRVRRTIEDLARNQNLAKSFDIIDSHNANKDYSATNDNWASLVQAFKDRKPVWASENPANWNVGTDQSLPGIADAVHAGVQGLVIWFAKPGLVDDNGRPTPKALDIAAHLVK